MRKKKPDREPDEPKKPNGPLEVCNYCDRDVFCCWTVRMGLCEYAMCEGCTGEAQKDFFSFSIRTDADRERSKKIDEEDTSGE